MVVTARGITSLEPSSKIAYVVLGMHRSGTSSVAGTLALLGARAPHHLMGAKADNPSGFWESEKITEFNEQIFYSAGSSWKDWGLLDPSVFTGPDAETFDKASRWLIGSEYGGAETIVLKDPRICRIYPFWRSALESTGYQPLVVCPIRAPEEVAASLSARNGISRSLALKLWLQHVLEAERTSRGQLRHLMLWSDFLRDWRSQIRRLSENLARPSLLPSAAEDAITSFLDPSLRRQRGEKDAAPGTTPDMVQRAYRALSELATNGETPEAHLALDGVRDEFHAAMQFYYDGPSRV